MITQAIVLALAAILNVCLEHIWTFPFIFTKRRLFKTSDLVLINKFAGKSKRSSMTIDNTARGWVFGDGFSMIVYSTTSDKGSKLSAFIFTSEKRYNDEKFDIDSECTNSYKSALVTGNCWELNFLYNNVAVKPVLRDWQETLVNETIAMFKEREVCTVLISGTTGCGKTSIGEFIANRLKATLVCNYDCTKPFKLADILSSVNTNDDTVVISVDEIDSIMANMNSNYRPYAIPDATDKTSWNMLFDSITRSRYGKVIVIATTNKRLDEFPDQSMINSSRFMIKYEVGGIPNENTLEPNASDRFGKTKSARSII